MAAIVLTACAAPDARRPSPAKPRVSPTRPVTNTPAPTPPNPSIDPGNYQQDKERLRLALARNRSESLAPGEAGYYMDVLQGRLRQIGNSQFGLAHEGSRIVVTLIGTGSGGTRIDAPLPTQLVTLAKVLAEYRKTLVSVQAEAGGDDTKARHCTLQAIRTLRSGGVNAQHIAAVGMPAPLQPIGTVDFSGCSTVVLQLEPIVRAE